MATVDRQKGPLAGESHSHSLLLGTYVGLWAGNVVCMFGSDGSL
jgi:hypothetical protein